MYTKRIVYSLCTAIVMAIIFAFSCQNGEDTIKTSNVIVNPIRNEAKNISDIEFEEKGAGTEYWIEFKYKLEKAVRKSAHAIIFGVLALFVYLLCRSYSLSCADAIMITLIVCGIYAGTDEFHQKFVEGRTSRFSDACIDIFGSMVCLIILWILSKIKNIKKSIQINR